MTDIPTQPASSLPGSAVWYVSRRTLLRTSLAILTLSLLAACSSGSGNDDPDDPEDQTSDESGVVIGPPVLGPVVWSTAISPDGNEPTGPVAQFTVDVETIYAVFPVERLAADTNIRAAWTLDGESMEGVGAELTTQRDQVGGWLEFHLTRTSNDVWPDGQYGISLTTANVLIATGTVQVVRADT